MEAERCFSDNRTLPGAGHEGRARPAYGNARQGRWQLVMMRESPPTPNPASCAMIRFLALTAACLTLAGCGSSGPTKYPVEGMVYYDNKPIPSGNLTLMPIDEAVAPDAVEITNGKFTLMSTPGKRRVEIRANRDKPGNAANVKAMGVPVEREQYLPAKYNDKSELTVEIKPDGTANKGLEWKIPAIPSS